jgi:hypothetical protein
MIGQAGLKSFEERRGAFLGSAFIFQALALALTIYALVAMSTEGRDVQSTYWAYGKLDNGDLFVGLRVAVIDLEVYESSDIEFAGDQCSDFEFFTGQTFCNECKVAGSDAIVCLILSGISALFLAVLSVLRLSPGMDSNAIKVTTLTISVFGGVVGMVSFAVFGDTCYRNLPISIQGEEVSYVFGPGWFSAVVAFLFIVISTGVHAIVPVATNRPVNQLARKLIAKEKQGNFDGYNF